MKAVSVNAQELLLTTSGPPPDVAADPGRLAVWNATAKESKANYEDLTAISIEGCGIRQTYLCWDESSPDGEEIDYFCEEIEFSDPGSRLGAFALSASVRQALREQLAVAR